MLNGLDPIIIFRFSKRVENPTETQAKIPLVDDVPTMIPGPPIPIYLSETLTGIFIDMESKNIDAQTTTETKTTDANPSVKQSGIANNVVIDLKGKKESTGLSLFLALADFAYTKLTSQEYSITYLHGPVTVFNGLLNHFSFTSDPNEDIIRIKIELSMGGAKEPTPQANSATVQKSTGTLPTLN